MSCLFMVTMVIWGCQKGFFEEVRSDTGKDTSRMLRAGAEKVFFLCGDSGDILEDMRRFRGAPHRRPPGL